MPVSDLGSSSVPLGAIPCQAYGVFGPGGVYDSDCHGVDECPLGHSACPDCPHEPWRIVYPRDDRGSRIEDEGVAGRRLGLETAAALGMLVENATFINYDRPGMVAGAHHKGAASY